ncbi:acetyltransferase [Thomasclavelia spiroformis]|uniref:acetyltransferase n=1 Tax=Thomasclavelia spiroformis TaxID=29348 RepID=UPI000B38149E|nr:acetyltransferase [Thomasclavelia spiroformis]OUO70293.1 acetyltransferase [Thomasclavelia spiroformis]
MKEVIIVGAGGHAKVIADIIRLNGDKVIGYLDDSNSLTLSGYNIIGTTNDIGKKDCWYFVAIGNNILREKLMSKETKWYTAIHPTAIIGEDVVIEDGTCIMANVVINSGSKIGKGVIINTASTVDHDCNISDYVHIAPGVHISGTVTVSKNTWVGVGSIISNNIKICSGCMIGAGAVVVKDIREKGTYVGVPAKKIK